MNHTQLLGTDIMRSLVLATLFLAVPISQSYALEKPEGSYRKTCHHQMVFGPMLEAKCERKDGSMAQSTINWWNCDAPIVNVDGVLKCKDHTRRSLPGGSYKDSCHHIRMHHHKLEAECQKRDGEWQHSSLNVKNCYGSVVNNNGHLRCE